MGKKNGKVPMTRGRVGARKRKNERIGGRKGSGVVEQGMRGIRRGTSKSR